MDTHNPQSKIENQKSKMPLLWLSLAFLSGILLAASLPLPPLAWWSLAAVGLIFTLLPLLTKFASPDARLTHLSRSSTLSEVEERSDIEESGHIETLTYHVSRITHHLPPFPYSLIPLLFAFGALRYQSSLPDLSDPTFLARYNDLNETFVVEGLLIEPPEERDDSTALLLQVEQIRPESAPEFSQVRGRLLARISPEEAWRYGELRYGDRLRLAGRVETPPEGETGSYRDYLARQGIYSLMQRARAGLVQRGQGNPLLAAIYSLKSRSLRAVYRLYPDPEASLLAGILLGVDTRIPEQLKQAYSATGTAHIIAISGFNFAVIAGMFSSLFGRLLGSRRRFLAAGLSIGCIAVYAVLVGGSASVVRAAIMGGLSLFARQTGRRQHGLNSLAFVAALMALFNPSLPWDVGFQLSFTATLGLILYAEPRSQSFQRLVASRLSPVTASHITRPVSEYLLFTLAAQLTSLPVILYHFGRLSLSSLVANPLVLPAQPAVMILGGLAVLLGLVWLLLGRLAAALAWPFVAYTNRVVELLGGIQGGDLEIGPLSLAPVLLFYAALFGWTFAARRLRSLASAVKPALALALLGGLAAFVWRSALAAPDGRLHLTLLAAGGDAVLIQSPGGGAILVGGCPSASGISDALGRRLPPLHRRLDWVIAPASGKDQLDGMERLLERFPTGNLLWAGQPGGSSPARDLGEILAEADAAPLIVQAGQSLELGSGAVLRVLAAGEDGALLMLEWENFHALLPVGQESPALESLPAGLGPLDVLLLPGSGSDWISSPEWIDRLEPQVVLYAGEQLGLPDSETSRAMQGRNVLRADRNGWVHLSTDGEQMWVEVERR